jgi:CHAT domain-containing protein
MMSIARAFAFAGCPSILMSLWEVDDLSTSKLMELFYQELAAGKPKDEALRNAKLAYLDSSSGIQSHPFYWAGFIQTGDRSPIGGDSTLFWVLMGILATGIAGLIFFSDRI